MKQTKDIEYHKKILKLGVLKLEESKVHREAIVKLMAPLNLSERKEIQREMDEFFLEEIKMSQTNFPNGWAYILGGCIFFDGKKEKAITYQCQSCVEAQEFWLRYYRWFTNLENLSEKGIEYEILEEIFNKTNWNSSTTDKNDFIKKVFSRAYERFSVRSTEKQ